MRLWPNHLLDPGLEDAAVHRRVDDLWRGQPVTAQTGAEALPFGRPSGAFGQLGDGCVRLAINSLDRLLIRLTIDKKQPRQCLVEETLASPDPEITGMGDLRLQLFACLDTFLWLSPSRLRNRPTVKRCTPTPRPASSTQSSSSVTSPFWVTRAPIQSPCGVSLPSRRMALPLRRKRAGGPMHDHHVVDKSRRHPEMPSRFPMAVAFFYKSNDTRTQLDRMRLAHGGSPSMAKVNHKSISQGIPNLNSRDAL
ncbi:hypothetical protein [Hoeflea alexandrii]|uniref:hypothetical protein n=1 Tax=Hoeflea alexandrii TaxID=288436 RepID=UPI0022AFFD15|nr:hypothetical protein [Hoeflea alexandrii]MCZ4291908.1 hypothetical protein [Hoeflea alexandrii]